MVTETARPDINPAMTRTEFKIATGDEERSIVVVSVGDGAVEVTVEGGDGALALDVQQVGPREYHALYGDRSIGFLLDGELPSVTLHHAGEAVKLELLDERRAARLSATGADGVRSADGTVAVTAPMPGKVVKCLVTDGDRVKSGQGVVIVEAMKMENELRSAVDGAVKEVRVKEGDNVDAGECLVVIE